MINYSVGQLILDGHRQFVERTNTAFPIKRTNIPVLIRLVN